MEKKTPSRPEFRGQKTRQKRSVKKYLLSSSCEADKGPADLLGSSLNDLGVGGLPSIILLWLSASSRLNSWLGVDKWSCKKAHRSLSRWHKSKFQVWDNDDKDNFSEAEKRNIDTQHHLRPKRGRWIIPEEVMIILQEKSTYTHSVWKLHKKSYFTILQT